MASLAQTAELHTTRGNGRFHLFSSPAALMTQEPQIIKIDTRTGKTWILIFNSSATNRSRKLGFYEIPNFDSTGASVSNLFESESTARTNRPTQTPSSP